MLYTLPVELLINILLWILGWIPGSSFSLLLIGWAKPQACII
jgi:uncharacterized membrane protein YqaE (UPF0057 family)